MFRVVCPACGIASSFSDVFVDPGTLNQECPNCGSWSPQDDWEETHGDDECDPNNPENYDVVQDESGNIIQCNYCGSYEVAYIEFDTGMHMCCCDCNIILE